MSETQRKMTEEEKMRFQAYAKVGNYTLPKQKTCNRCNVTKDIDQFYKGELWGTYQSKCKQCKKEMRKK